MGLVTLFVIMMMMQMGSSYVESRKINQYFYQLKQRGNVLVGKKSSYFFAGCIIMFVLDDQLQVTEYHIRQGVSVFSQFKVTLLNRPTNINNLKINGNHQLQQAIAHAKSFLA